ncbi:MAG: ABC transporter ATP-binding protein [Dinghuibacter sp.]|nr:ABC transporter ATP-binding protein [Dinghuibacter sp.]
MAALLVTGLAMGYCTLLLPLSIGKYLEILLGEPTGKSQALELMGIGIPGAPGPFFTFFFTLLVTRFFIAWLYHYQAGRAGEHFVHTLRSQHLFAAMEQPAAGTPGGGSTNQAGDAASLKRLITKGLLGFVHNCILLLGAFYVLYRVQPLVTILASLCFLLFYMVNYWLNHLFKPVTAEKRKRQTAWLQVANGIARGHNNNRAAALTRLQQKTTTLHRALRRYLVRRSALKALPSFQMYLMLGCIMPALLAQQKTNPAQNTGALSCFLLLITLFPVMRNLLNASQVWATGALAARKYMHPGHNTGKQSKKNLVTAVTFEADRQQKVQYYGTHQPTGTIGRPRQC